MLFVGVDEQSTESLEDKVSKTFLGIRKVISPINPKNLRGKEVKGDYRLHFNITMMHTNLEITRVLKPWYIRIWDLAIGDNCLFSLRV